MHLLLFLGEVWIALLPLGFPPSEVPAQLFLVVKLRLANFEDVSPLFTIFLRIFRWLGVQIEFLERLLNFPDFAFLIVFLVFRLIFIFSFLFFLLFVTLLFNSIWGLLFSLGCRLRLRLLLAIGLVYVLGELLKAVKALLLGL